MVLPVKTQNIPEDEGYISTIIHDGLESAVRSYTSYVVVDLTNEKEIKALQAKSEGDSYDEDQIIELQRLTSANYALFSNLVKIKRNYILTVSFTNLVTGIKEAAPPPALVKDVESLFTGAGNAIGKVTVQLCKQLGIPLTQAQIAALDAGEAAPPSEVKEEKKNTKVQLGWAKSPKELKSLGYYSFNFDNDAEDNIVISTVNLERYEVDIYATHRKKGFKYFGTVVVTNKKKYKGNPLDKDLDQYPAIYMKVLNDEEAEIFNMGESHSDQYFEIR